MSYKHVFENDGFDWFAVDKNGNGYEFTQEPAIDSEYSVWDYSDTAGEHKGVNHDYKGDWEKSLQKREEKPEVEEHFPKVGEMCEVKVNNDADGFLKCNVMYLSEEWCLMTLKNIGEVAYLVRELEFRPIKTEREMFVDVGLDILKNSSGIHNSKEMFCRLYDSNKFKLKDSDDE